MKQTLRDLAEKLGCRILGDSSVQVASVSSLQSAHAESIVFVEDQRHLETAQVSEAAAVIAGEFAGQAIPRKPLLIARQPRLAFARAARLLRDEKDRNRDIHPSAIVPPSVQLGEGISVGPRAILGRDVRIGDGTTVGAGCVVGERVEIGADCRLDAQIPIYSGTTLGERVVVQAGTVLGSDGFGYVRDFDTGRYEQFPQVGRLVIEDDGLGFDPSKVSRGHGLSNVEARVEARRRWKARLPGSSISTRSIRASAPGRTRIRSTPGRRSRPRTSPWSPWPRRSR